MAQELVKGNIRRGLVRLALPVIGAMLAGALLNLVDALWISHAGVIYLAVVNISSFAYWVLFAVAGIIATGANSLIAHRLGESVHDPQAAQKAVHVAQISLILAALLGIVQLGLVYRSGYGVMAFMGGGSEEMLPIAQMAYAYLGIVALMAPLICINEVFSAVFRAYGDTRTPMIVGLIGFIFNLVLDPILIFVLGLGVKGAAIATVFSQTMSCIFAVSFLCSRNVQLKLSFRDMRLGGKRCLSIVALGMSGFTMGATNSLVQLVCNKCAFIWGGDLYVGVMTILNSVREIYNTVMNGIGSGASPVMSFNYGAKDGERTIKASNFTLVCSFTYAMIAWLVIIIFPHAMAMLFTQDGQIIEASSAAMRIYFFGFFFMAFQTAGQQTFVALGKAKQAVFFSLFRKVIIVVPLTILLPFIFGINGVMMAEPISNVVGGLAAYLSMRHMVMPELRAMKKEQA